MRRKERSEGKKNSIAVLKLAGILAVMMVFLTAAASAEGSEKPEELKLESLKGAAGYCYPDADWGTKRKDAEEKLGIKLKDPVIDSGYGDKTFTQVRQIALNEKMGEEFLEFDVQGLEKAGVIFQEENGELEAFAEEVRGELENLYGQPEDVSERESLYPVIGKGMERYKRYRWTGTPAEGYVDALLLQIEYDSAASVKRVVLTVSRAENEKPDSSYEELDLADLKTGEQYGYKLAEWESSPEEIQKNLNITLKTPAVGNPDPQAADGYFRNVKILDYYGFKGFMHLEFKKKELQCVDFIFVTPNSTMDYTEFEKRVTEEITEMYGEPTQSVSADGLDSESSRVIRQLQWEGSQSDGRTNELVIIACENKDGQTSEVDIRLINYPEAQ